MFGSPLDKAAPTSPARRVDGKSGVREEVEFFGRGPDQMFGVLHLPPNGPHAGVVVCCPFQAELLKTYRREVLLARSLAGLGFAVQRFHYRGSGNSDGDASGATFDTMVEDAAAAADRLAERTGVTEIAWVGTRLGGLVAAAGATSPSEAAPLALWEPVIDPGLYFREVFRGLMVSDLKEDGVGRGRGDPQEELARNGSVDILGYTITGRLQESTLAHSLEGEVGERPRPILLVGSSRRGELPVEYAGLRDRWIARGLSVESHVVPTREPWWFGKNPTGRRDDLVRDKAFVDLVTAWLAKRLPRSGEAS